MFGYQGIALLERIRRISRYGLVGASVSLGVVSEALAKSSVFLSACGSGCSCQLLLQHHIFLHAAILPTMMIMD